MFPRAVRLSWLENAYCLFTPTAFWRAVLTSKVGQGDLVLSCDHCSLVGLCVQDYNSLCAAVAICDALVNIQTHRQHLASLYE